MRILYVFPHPDDESFGPAKAIARQVREGHEVHLLTLTKGEATKMRLRLGLSKAEMRQTRFEEMREVERTLGLAGMTVLDFPDSGLKEMDPRPIEAAIRAEIEKVQPAVLVTYAVHGISGFHDHLVGHAAVKRVYIEMREGADHLKRLAFYTVTADEAHEGTQRSGWHLNHSKDEEIDCVMEVTGQDLEQFRAALDCYVTYRDVIEETGMRENSRREVPFEIFGEDHDPPLSDLFESL